MELLNNTSSPSINGSNISSAQHSETLYQIPMEANNLAQDSVAVSLGNADAHDNVVGVGEGSGVVVELQQHKTLPRSSSSSDSESEEPLNSAAGTSADGNGERVASPPPNCAICLGRCKNKCFTDSCMHQFCFKCLCEWSKVKPECPLCKQTFKSIIHNVKSEDQFEEYHVQPPTVPITNSHYEMDLTQMRIYGVVSQNIGRSEAWNERVHRPLFIYPGGGGSGSVPSAGIPAAGNNRTTAIRSLRNQYVYRGELLDLYRQDYPDSNLSQLWRRYVYDRRLYALPVCDITGRFRESSAQYYRDNPAQIHRLVPWISRDLQCLLRQSQQDGQSQHDVNTVLESINTALSLMNILSPAFRRRLQVFLGNKTAHFIHELNNFARSPYDMNGYDRVVEYSPQSNEDVVIEFSTSEESSDNDDIDDIDVADDSTVAIPNSASTNGGTIDYDDDNVPSYHRVINAHLNSFTAINLTIHNRLTSNGGRAAEATLSSSGSVRSVAQDGVSLVIDLRGESEEASASTATARSEPDGNTNPPQTTVTVAENIELTSGSSDECEFVLERKPPHLRTPEMVSLDSASDSDVVFIEESKPLNKSTFSTSEGEPEDDVRGEKPKRSSNRIKITALVEAKKRNQQSSNVVKNDIQSNAEIYNVGASTSAALRLSIQQRTDRSRMKRTKYSLRNSIVNPQQPPRRRGKRLPSESSHSSSCTTALSTSSNSESNEEAKSGCSTDEEYVLSAAQKRNPNPRKRRRVKKTRSGQCRSSSKSDSRKRNKPNNEQSTGIDDDEEEDDNGHLGKNFALVMAIGERLKRQKEKHKKTRRTDVSNDEDHSDEENSWRLKAVNEPLRKQQEQRVIAKRVDNQRKRKLRRSSQTAIDNAKQMKVDHCDNTDLTNGAVAKHINSDSSSDESESDNLKLIELKSKLRRKSSNTSLEATVANCLESEMNELVGDSASHSQIQNKNEGSPRPTFKQELPETPLTPAAPSEANDNDVDSRPTTQPDVDLHSSDDDNDDQITQLLNANGEQQRCNYKGDKSNVSGEYSQDHIDNDYSNETTNLSSPMAREEEEDENGGNHEDDDDVSEAALNIPTSLNLSHESNVFDGASMSTTTTDTILNDTAEQISSAAVNFHNPQQQSFNTADFNTMPTGCMYRIDPMESFIGKGCRLGAQPTATTTTTTADLADDNTSNSSCSESSVSSTTTATSSNSSSSNTNGFVNYNLS
uniref:E3 ubiquitin-protein ligase Topors n=1 Tax=Stomoxys calcitrans TaxID=35570 RepID=A0A1I8PSU9_STOCA